VMPAALKSACTCSRVLRLVDLFMSECVKLKLNNRGN
jgi:hypothetical protein